MGRKNRQSNIEFLRIVLMLMIISHHILVHGLGLLKSVAKPNFTWNAMTATEVMMNCFLVLGVNGFVFISGYFGIKFNPKRIGGIVVQAIFYSVVLYLASLLWTKASFNSVLFKNSFLPISNNTWWFITTYIWLYLLAPFINSGVKYLSKSEIRYILLGLFILNCYSQFFYKGLGKHGYDLFHFIFLYVLGQYMRTYKIVVSKPAITLIICILLSVLTTYLLIQTHHTRWVGYVFFYNNPIVIVAAIAFFFLFYNWKMKSYSIINRVAQSVLGVYMIHEYPACRKWIMEVANTLHQTEGSNAAYLVGWVLALAIGIFVASSLIELSRWAIVNAIGSRMQNMKFYQNIATKLSSRNQQ